MPDAPALPEHIEEHLTLAADGVVRQGIDERWAPILLNVARRGIVTAADRRAARRLLEEFDLD
jgi:hypothetical protein